MDSKTDQAIVLNTRQFGESDLIVCLFTKGEGKLSGIAKGAKNSRKRFGAALEMGSLIQILYEEKPQRELLLLKEASLLDVSQPWRSSWPTIAVTSYCLELASKLLPERQAALQKFEVFKIFLISLREPGAMSLLFDFEFHWLSLSGWEPNLNVCGICGMKLLGSKTLETSTWPSMQPIFDHYWQHIFTKPPVSRKLLDEAFL